MVLSNFNALTALGMVALILLKTLPGASTWTLQSTTRPQHQSLLLWTTPRPWGTCRNMGTTFSPPKATTQRIVTLTARKNEIDEEEEDEDEEYEWEYVEDDELIEEDDDDEGEDDDEELDEDDEEYDMYEEEEDEEAELDEEEYEDDEEEAPIELKEEEWLEEDEEREVETATETAASGLEGVADSDEWDEEEEDYPLQDDPSDPNYTKQKEIIDNAVAASEQLHNDRDFDAVDFMVNKMTPEQMKAMDQLPFIQEAMARAKELEITETDVQNIDVIKDANQVPDLMDDDPYPRHEAGEVNILERNVGLTDDDMEQVDNAWKMMKETINAPPFDQVTVRAERGIEGLSEETIQEIEDVLDEIGGAPYNVTRMLLYELDFNVTNLMLASVKHNREAPILYAHWYPQLITYKRYASDVERDFDFSWDDVEAADMSELERYYQGMGFDEIPAKAPGETGIIEFGYLDEEEMKMAAFEEWMRDVYNPELDIKDFDDDDILDEDNIFSENYVAKQHPDVPTINETRRDIEGFHARFVDDEQLTPDSIAYSNYSRQWFEYEEVVDPEFQEQFRGHLVVACTPDDSDLEIAEKITLAMSKALGKQIYVETRVISHATLEDNVFEVWLESYEIDLLHSKKRATSNALGWTGPAECDDKQVAALVEQVSYLISDESRYSYTMEFDGVV